jgi:hypothetical protein
VESLRGQHWFSEVLRLRRPGRLALAAKARAIYHTGTLSNIKEHESHETTCRLGFRSKHMCELRQNDFVGPIQAVPTMARLQGFFRHGPRIRGIGHIAWSFTDVNGMLRTLKLPAIPDVKQR